jgi:hypothetical protein
MTNFQTDPRLLTKLEKAAKRRLSPEELRRQKVSFILGSLGEESTITRERVERELDKLEGNAA